MQVLTKGVMPDKTKIQLEDWSTNFPALHAENDTLVAYPIAKQPATVLEFECVNGFRKYEYPQLYRTFRLAFQFPCAADAEAAYNKLLIGTANLLDYEEYMQEKKYSDCLRA